MRKAHYLILAIFAVVIVLGGRFVLSNKSSVPSDQLTASVYGSIVSKQAKSPEGDALVWRDLQGGACLGLDDKGAPGIGRLYKKDLSVSKDCFLPDGSVRYLSGSEKKLRENETVTRFWFGPFLGSKCYTVIRNEKNTEMRAFLDNGKRTKETCLAK